MGSSGKTRYNDQVQCIWCGWIGPAGKMTQVDDDEYICRQCEVKYDREVEQAMTQYFKQASQ